MLIYTLRYRQQKLRGAILRFAAWAVFVILCGRCSMSTELWLGRGGRHLLLGKPG
jgi:hypothetical protein